MPSRSRRQHNLMEAFAHGWRPAGKAVPQSVAKEFVAADKRAGKYQGKKRK